MAFTRYPLHPLRSSPVMQFAPCGGFFGLGTPKVFCKLAQGCPSAGYPGKTRRGVNPNGVVASKPLGKSATSRGAHARSARHNPLRGWNDAGVTPGSPQRATMGLFFTTPLALPARRPP